MSIISTLLPTFAVDYVALYDNNFNQIFKKARAINANIREISKVMEHPLEDGSVISDHRILLPTEIDLTLMLSTRDYEDTYLSIKQYYDNATLLIVQTRSDVYQDFVIEAMPHDENPGQYDTITLILTLKKVRFVTPKYGFLPKNPANNNTVDRGIQQSPPATSTQTATTLQAISRLPSKLINWIKGV